MESFNLEYYRAFYTVAQTGNVTKAAELLCLSQPAVTRSIHRLEESLGCKLFTRVSRGVRLTVEWVVIYVITHRFCCSHPRISQGRGSVRGKPLRVSPLAFNHPPAGDRFCAAKSPLQKKRPPNAAVT